MAFERVDVGVVVPEDRTVRLTDDAGVIAIFDGPDLAENIDPERLLDVHEQPVTARQPSDDAIPVRFAMPLLEVMLHDLTRREKVLKIAIVNLEVRLKCRPSVAIS